MEERIEIPENVEMGIEEMTVTVKGPKGQLEKNFNNPRFNDEIEIRKEDGSVAVKTESDKRKVLAVVGTMAAHIRNMFVGVLDGYEYELRIIYTHFPITVTEKGGLIEIKNFLGEKGVRKARVVGDCKIHIEKDAVKISSISVEDVGQTAANIERACKLKGRDRRIFQDGIFLHDRRLQSGKVI